MRNAARNARELEKSTGYSRNWMIDGWTYDVSSHEFYTHVFLGENIATLLYDNIWTVFYIYIIELYIWIVLLIIKIKLYTLYIKFDIHLIIIQRNNTLHI